MSDLTFIIVLAGGLALYLGIGFRVLPKERWQIFASMPMRKEPDGSWRGLNLTFYGVLSGNGYAFAVAIFILLMSSIGTPLEAMVLSTTLALVVCLPASRVLARLVNRKKHTLSIGGGYFITCLTLPLVIYALDHWVGPHRGWRLPLLPTLAAACTAYTFGEGIGRLACVSFGCCFGRPIDQCPAWVRRLFGRCAFVFTGHCKKAAYEKHYDGVPLVPIQAITAVVLNLMGLLGLYLFLHGNFVVPLLIGMGGTQVWRFASEFLRDDTKRNVSGVTPYQLMALAVLIEAVLLSWWLAAETAPPPQLRAALHGVWQPGVIVFIQLVWLATFLYTGLSEVTLGRLRFDVRRDRVHDEAVTDTSTRTAGDA